MTVSSQDMYDMWLREIRQEQRAKKRARQRTPITFRNIEERNAHLKHWRRGTYRVDVYDPLKVWV